MIESVAIIDVWDVETFDSELRGDFDAHADVIRNYMLTSRRQWLEREASDHTMPYPENPYAGEFMWVKEHIMRLMEVRTIRAWHYTRLTDAEVGILRQGGIYPSSLDTIQSRFAAQVAAGTFSQEVTDRLFADSPYQSDQLDSRSNKFWMVSHPVDVEDGGVELLLEIWGGESAYFWQRDAALQDMLKQIGRPRVLEIAMPLVNSRHGYSAAEAVVATYGRCSAAGPTNMCSTSTHISHSVLSMSSSFIAKANPISASWLGATRPASST
ncbi:hypothetical protein NKI38_31765 [Mesorhizobium sp. M0621]|uniref:hypothetical protein n=1 Tax=Mesorhizobium sp. M0621 TaxID=2956974 RepID=UPI003336FAAB